MPISTTDLKEYGSANANSDGGALDTGKVIDTTGKINGTTDLFPLVTGDQAAAGITIYRKVFRRNENATLTWYDVKTWISQQVIINAADRLYIGIGIDNAADNDSGQGNMVALSANSAIAAVSDSGTDARTLTIMGKDANGVYQTETLTLNGTTEVVGTLTFSQVLACYLSATDAATVTIRQGSGGSTIGTIGPNKIICWLWVQPASKTDSNVLVHGDVATNGVIGLWYKLVVPAGSTAANYTAQTTSEGDTGA